MSLQANARGGLARARVTSVTTVTTTLRIS